MRRLAEYAGTWIIDRMIEDRMGGRTGHLTGTATFTPDDAGLIYHETGTLLFPGQPALSASQSYLWRPVGDEIAVSFADGRPFHRIALASGPVEARHDCDPDVYHVRYDFAGWPKWSARWRVHGPRKDFDMTTTYRR